MVRIHASHAWYTGSIPVGATKVKEINKIDNPESLQLSGFYVIYKKNPEYILEILKYCCPVKRVSRNLVGVSE